MCLTYTAIVINGIPFRYLSHKIYDGYELYQNCIIDQLPDRYKESVIFIPQYPDALFFSDAGYLSCFVHGIIFEDGIAWASRFSPAILATLPRHLYSAN